MEEAKQDAGGLSPVHDSQGSTGEGTGHSTTAPRHRAALGPHWNTRTTARTQKPYWSNCKQRIFILMDVLQKVQYGFLLSVKPWTLSFWVNWFTGMVEHLHFHF